MRRLASCITLLGALASAAGAQTHWVATWGASPAPQLPQDQMEAAHLLFQNQTLREIVHTSIGGTAVRVRLSNAYSRTPVDIGAVQIAIRGKDSAIAAGTSKSLTFGGRTSVQIPADALVLSDPFTVNAP